MESVSILLQAVKEELQKRANHDTLNRLPTDKLFTLYLALENRLKEETENNRIDFSALGAWASNYEMVEVD